MAMLKGLGAVMTLELEMPGDIIAVNNTATANHASTHTIDLLDPLVWSKGYSVKAKEWTLFKGVGLMALAILVIAAGYAATSILVLPALIRTVVLPLAMLIALLIMILPIWMGSFLAKEAPPEIKLQTSSAPAPASNSVAAPALAKVVDAPPLPPAPLESTSVSNWRQYAGQHPIDVMEDTNLSPRFKQVLGSDYEFVKNAVSTASPTSMDAGYVIGSGMAPHSGGIDSAIWSIDTQNGQICAVWKQDSQIKAYGAAHEQRLPARLYRWYKEMGGPN